MLKFTHVRFVPECRPALGSREALEGVLLRDERDLDGSTMSASIPCPLVAQERLTVRPLK